MKNQRHSRKNVIENSNVSAGGNIHIGDVYANNPTTPEPGPPPKSPKAILRSILIVVIGIVIGFLGELIPDTVKTSLEIWVTTYLRISYLTFWLVLTIIIVFILLWLTRKEVLGDHNEQDPVKKFEPKVREWLKKRYENRLDQKTAGRLPINLRRIDFSESAAQITQKKFKEILPEAVNVELAQFFKIAEGRLLIVGAPGAGKTTLLLQLAAALLNTETDALPAVVNLATWSNEFNSIEEWLKKILPIELGVSTALAMQLLGESRVVLLFDGLDEIPTVKQRSACLTAIDLFASPARPRREFAISSRIQEFRESQHVPMVSFPIEVGALTMDQLEIELTHRTPPQPEDRDLLAVLQNDTLLREVAETPLYFNCLQLLFGENQRPIFLDTNREVLERKILDTFIKNELNKCKAKDVKRWLGFLANQMNKQGLVQIGLKDLQYNWSSWSKLTLVISGISEQVIVWVQYFFIPALLFGFFFTLTVLYSIKIAIEGVLVPVLCSFIFFAVIGIYQGLMFRNSRILTYYSSVAIKDFIPDLKNASRLFVLGIFIVSRSIFTLGVFYGILLSIFMLFLLQIYMTVVKSAKEIGQRDLSISSPYQHFTNSAKLLHFSILQHFVLRLLLSKKGLLPLRLVDFLNEMASFNIKTRHFTTHPIHLFESDGASWSFRHRLIQEWFATRWEEDINKN